MIGKAEIACMRRGAMLINASRGNVVDIESLATALRDERLSGAAVDVFPKEPKSRDEVFQSPLREFDNVLLTPHVGGSTQEAQINIGTEVASKLVRYSDNGSTLSAVNFPEVSLPEHAGSRRLLHIHHNVPGVLSRINDVFSQSAVNINGQHLQTDGDLGYVVIDVSASEEKSESLREQLSAIPGTVRTRLLY
jgi:D-3-phosphoglycerate dehydrogenase